MHRGPITILEENHYYPFGMKHSYNASIREWSGSVETGDLQAVLMQVERGKYQYKYNGKEYQDELGLNLYDMDFRDYDPAIARWTGIDPVIHYSQSTFNAFDGNPVFWADPSGADSSSGGFSTDVFGRERFDNNGIYIPFGERVGSNFENYFKNESISDDGRGAGYVANNNDVDQEESFKSTEELLKFIDDNIGDSQTIMKELKTEIVLATNSNLPEGYALKGQQLYNDKGGMVGGTTVSLYELSLKSRIYISPNIKENIFGNINVAQMTIVHELIHAKHRALELTNYKKYTEAAASTYTYVYLKAYGDGGKINKYYTDFYKTAIKPVPKSFLWRNLPSIINKGIR